MRRVSYSYPDDMSQEKAHIKVSEELIAAIARSNRKFCSEIRNCDPKAAAIELAKGYRGAFDFIQPYLSLYAKPKILEIGSGYGFGLCYMLKSRLDVIGVEPGSGVSFEGRFTAALNLLEANGITPADAYLLRAYAEDLPFEDNTFDIVFSIAVLEHVRDIQATMTAVMRVTKPGGVVIMNVPNYNSFREQHYNIMWLPFVLSSKKIAKWYVRTIFSRPDYYVDELKFTTPKQFRKLEKNLPGSRAFKIHYCCERPFGKLSTVHYYLSQGLTSNNRLLETLRRSRLLNKVLRLSSGFVSSVLGRMGLAPVFNVVCFKKSDE